MDETRPSLSLAIFGSAKGKLWERRKPCGFSLITHWRMEGEIKIYQILQSASLSLDEGFYRCWRHQLTSRAIQNIDLQIWNGKIEY